MPAMCVGCGAVFAHWHPPCPKCGGLVCDRTLSPDAVPDGDVWDVTALEDEWLEGDFEDVAGYRFHAPGLRHRENVRV